MLIEEHRSETPQKLSARALTVGMDQVSGPLRLHYISCFWNPPPSLLPLLHTCAYSIQPLPHLPAVHIHLTPVIVWVVISCDPKAVTRTAISYVLLSAYQRERKQINSWKIYSKNTTELWLRGPFLALLGHSAPMDKLCGQLELML